MPRHPYRRLRRAKSDLPEVGISEEGNIRSLHLGSDTIQSSMNLDHPAELVLSYSRAMMGWLLFAEETPKHITQIGLGGGSFAEYIKVFRHNTDVILVDGFDGEQIIDALVEEPFFQDCRNALSPDGVFVTNWWSGDKRYQRFVERLLNVFEGRVLELPAESHGNMAVMAFQSSPKEQNLDKLKKRAEKLSEQYGLDFKRMLTDLKASNPNNGKHFYL